MKRPCLAEAGSQAPTGARVNLDGGVATIDRDRCAGDELGLVAGQEDDQVGDLLGFAHASCRVQLGVLFQGRRVDQRGANNTRCHRIHADSFLGIHGASCPGHVDDAALRSRVGDVVRDGDNAEH